MKRVNVTQWLNSHAHGVWRYDRKSRKWYNNYGEWVSRVHAGGCDENGDALPGVRYVLRDMYDKETTIYPR
jgi:hypothetical protein